MNSTNFVNSKNNFLILTIIGFLFFSNYFFLGTAVPSYVLGIFIIIFHFKKIKFNIFQIISILLLILYFFFVSSLATHELNIFKNFKYYFGFVTFIIILQCTQFNFFLAKKYFKFLFYLIIFESLLINTIINSKNFYVDYHPAFYFNFYQRPASFGGNASVSSTLIVCFFFFFEKYFNYKYKLLDFILFFLSVVLLFSTTGFFLCILMIFLRLNNKKNYILKFLLLIFILILIYISSLIPQVLDDENLIYENYQKISLDYFVYIINEKYENIKYLFYDFNIFSYENLFGKNNILNITSTSGDNGLVNFIQTMGYFGLLIFFLIIFSFSKKKNSATLFLLIVGSLHYPAIMSPIGQFFFAYILLASDKYNKFTNKFI